MACMNFILWVVWTSYLTYRKVTYDVHTTSRIKHTHHFLSHIIFISNLSVILIGTYLVMRSNTIRRANSRPSDWLRLRLMDQSQEILPGHAVFATRDTAWPSYHRIARSISNKMKFQPFWQQLPARLHHWLKTLLPLTQTGKKALTLRFCQII